MPKVSCCMCGKQCEAKSHKELYKKGWLGFTPRVDICHPCAQSIAKELKRWQESPDGGKEQT